MIKYLFNSIFVKGLLLYEIIAETFFNHFLLIDLV